MSHTKGPWRAQGNIIWGQETAKRVATLSSQHFPDGEEAANAALIRSAPELLEALQEATATILGVIQISEGMILPVSSKQALHALCLGKAHEFILVINKAMGAP